MSQTALPSTWPTWMSKDVLWEEMVLEIFPAFCHVPIPTSECVRSGNNLF